MKNLNTKITITKLDRAERCGDWHDKPLRWLVTGPEIQKFATKKDATLWAKLRRQSASMNETFTKFMQASGLYA